MHSQIHIHYYEFFYPFSRLKHKDVFPLIHKYNLFDSISDKIVMLMDFDKERAVALLLDNTERIPVSRKSSIISLIK